MGRLFHLEFTVLPGTIVQRIHLIDFQGLSFGSYIKIGSNTIYGLEKLHIKK